MIGIAMLAWTLASVAALLGLALVRTRRHLRGCQHMLHELVASGAARTAAEKNGHAADLSTEEKPP